VHRRNRRRFRSKNRLILRKIRASRYASLIRLSQMKSEELRTNLSGEGHDAMARNQTRAAPLIPARPTLASLRKAAATCKACDLWKRGTQTVFGEGKTNGRVMFVGEQPGDREDIVGRPWLDAEIAVVKPNVLVCLEATAAQTLLGKDFRISTHRGELIDSPLAPFVTATVHPSSILRAQDKESRHREMEAFVSDLKKVRTWMAKSATSLTESRAS